MKLLVVAEQAQGRLLPSVRNTLGAAARLGGEIHVLLAGAQLGDAAREVAACAGVSRVLVAEAAHYREVGPENLAALVVEVVREQGMTHVLAAASSLGKDCMPRVAALLDVAQISDVLAVQGPATFVRPLYAGNALATVESSDPIKVLTVRSIAFSAVAEGGAGPLAPIELLPAGPDLGLTCLLGRELASGDQPELGRARVVVAGGRGLGSAAQFQQLLEPLARRLGAALAASRAAVDGGFAANDCQVGQTGRIVAPDLYLAVGISGAIQHLAGMRDSRVIVAINKDPEAPIFQVADYGLVGDLIELLPQLLEALQDQP